jgi:alpha-L-fucosidase
MKAVHTTLLLLLNFTLAMGNAPQVKIIEFSNESPEQKAERMDWFDDARFGMFIHWGLYAQPAGVWKDVKNPHAGEWLQCNATIPTSDYSELIETFNPVKYDPEAWVKMAKDAGMRYVVITSKHHDGFALYDSQYSNWDMGGTPYQKDLLKPLAEACRKHGLKICWYYSIMDWHHPHYGDKDVLPWRGNSTIEAPDMQQYLTFMKSQLHELLTLYGDIGLLWFDGQWEGSWTHEMGKELYDYCRTLQPEIIINNRVDKGWTKEAGLNKPGEFRGDYGTPEQKIPATGFGPDVYWESCMTMNDTWGFKTHDHNWKSEKELIRNLIDIASKGGNFLLNVGPTAEGLIPEPSIERLQAMAAWMKVNSESIHGTSASPFQKITWDGRCTIKPLSDGTVNLYLHVFEWPKERQLIIPQLENKPLSAFALANGKSLPISGKSGKWKIQLPERALDPIASVIRINLSSDL